MGSRVPAAHPHPEIPKVPPPPPPPGRNHIMRWCVRGHVVGKHHPPGFSFARSTSCHRQREKQRSPRHRKVIQSHIWGKREVQVLILAARLMTQGEAGLWLREGWPFGRGQWDSLRTKSTGQLQMPNRWSFLSSSLLWNLSKALTKSR